MAHLGMSDDEMTTFIKDGFGVDSSFSAKDLFEAAELSTLARGCRTYLPTPRGRHAASCSTYLPTPRAYRNTGPTYSEKVRNAGTLVELYPGSRRDGLPRLS